MLRILLKFIFAVSCLTAFGCAEGQPDDILVPDADGVNAGAVAAADERSDKSLSIRITLPLPRGYDPAVVPPIFHVDWAAEKTKSIRWIIVSTRDFGGSWEMAEEYIRNNPDAPEWSEWERYKPNKGEGTSYYPPPLWLGGYVFAVQARNSHGDLTDFDLEANMVRLLVPSDVRGPVFKVFNRYVGTMITASNYTPPTMIDIPSGVPMSFTLWATAEPYGAIVSGYRYGWDVIDPDDDSQWPMAFVPFATEVVEVPPRSFSAGAHTFCAETIDCWGSKSRVTLEMNVVPAAMSRPLLVVDDWVEHSSGWDLSHGAVPSDEQHDQFWLEMAAAVDGFDPSADVIEVNSDNIPPLDLLLNYKSIIWNGAASYNGTTASAINRIIRFIDPEEPAPVGRIAPNLIALYMAAGGHVLLCGEQIMTASINWESFVQQRRPAFPIIFRYELGGDQDGAYEDSEIGIHGIGEESFGYGDCCLNVLDIAYITSGSIRRAGANGCPVNTVRPAPQSGRTDGLRVALPAMGSGNFPTLTLRPEVSLPGRVYAEELSGLNCDIYNPPYFEDVCQAYTEYDTRSCFEPVYGNGCLNVNSKIYDAPVAFWTSVYADRVAHSGVPARSAVWGFHPVYFKPNEVRAALNIVLFDEWQLARRIFSESAWHSPARDGR